MRYSNMLWSTKSTIGLTRRCGHPLHQDLPPDVSTHVLRLCTVRSGRETEVDSVHLFLTVIQLAAHVILICQQNLDLYMYITSVDLTKAFDTVSRDGLWKIMATSGCPASFIAMVRQFHDGMLAWVQNDGEYLAPFPAGDKWSRARLCTGTGTVQHDVLSRACKCFSRL